jgi:hypothetical protein
MGGGRQSTGQAASPRTAQVREIVELACRAPSVHNTQPWIWHATGTRLELHADRSRQLAHSDPEGRNLVLSCGAALHHAQVAAAALGWRVSVERCPDPAQPDLLATLELTPGRVMPAAQEQLDALRARVTDRRRFTSWPLPLERLERLANEASEWGARVLPLVDPEVRARADHIMRRADALQRADAEFGAEAQRWIGAEGAEGIPDTSIPEYNPHRPAMPSRFLDGDLPDPVGDPSEVVDGLAALSTIDDGPLDWLRCGETLSVLWLGAVRHGLSLLPLSQAVEVPETREELRKEVLGGLGSPQLLVRIGWQEITRAPIPPTPRRPVDDVLR